MHKKFFLGGSGYYIHSRYSQLNQGWFQIFHGQRNSPTIDVNQECYKKPDVEKDAWNKNLTMLERKKYKISGIAHVFKVKRTVVRSLKILCRKSRSFESIAAKNVSREECLLLVMSKNCYGNKMKWNEDHCSYKQLAEETMDRYKILTKVPINVRSIKR